MSKFPVELMQLKLDFNIIESQLKMYHYISGMHIQELIDIFNNISIHNKLNFLELRVRKDKNGN